MTNKAIDSTSLGDLARTVGLTMRETDRPKVSELLVSMRDDVMRRADALPIESPPALFFDPR